MFCFNELAFTAQDKQNITQILGFILAYLSFTTGHFHTCTLQNVAYIIFSLILGSVFSDCVVFYGDKTLVHNIPSGLGV